ncbi:MAG TPA: (d)CMP kinase, partial [Thermodesulfovibrionia bacterium]|nr:(d)CMP kinase [Thermodesulfovibrionia bacterium]
AIDGPAGAGKSTVSKRLAEQLGYTYVDTGAMYRAAAWKMQESDINVDDTEAITKMLSEINLSFQDGHIILNEQDISAFIRTPQISELTSRVSTNSALREKMLTLQRSLCVQGSFVVEGRDIGTVVFPHVRHKFYLDASARIRAERRYSELQLSGVHSDFAALMKAIEERDKRDSERAFAPLKKAQDACYILTDTYSIEEVVGLIIEQLER